MFYRLLSIAEEAMGEFLSKAKGTAVDWVQIPGMKVFFYIIFIYLYLYMCGVQVCCITLIQTLGFTYQMYVFHYPCRADSFTSCACFSFESSLVRIRSGLLPFPIVAMEWQHEPAVLYL